MKIEKRVKCIHCECIVEGSMTCGCGKVMMNENVVVIGVQGIDYQDISQKLLNE